VDLHIHTCLSPCAEKDMTPRVIAGRAAAAGLDLIGICDHNSAENALAVRAAGAREGVAVVGGMEVSSREEIHLLALFGDDRRMSGFQQVVYDHLPGRNDERAFGAQLVIDEDDGITGRNERLLIGATDLSVEDIVGAIHGMGGLAVASHVDREGFSITGQLGFIPEGLELDALELSAGAAPGAEAAIPGRRGLPVIRSSDAHRPEEVGRACTVMLMKRADFGEVVMALHGDGGRKVLG